MSAEELFPLVNENGETIGKATRGECHSGSMLLHPVVHLHLATEDGRLYLQKRPMDKDIQPGKWDTAVGGHMDYGETVSQALARESREELGVDVAQLKLIPVAPYVFHSDRERELVNTFIAIAPDNITLTPDPGEIETGRFWDIAEIDSAVGTGVLTPNFEQEFARLRPLILPPEPDRQS